MNTMTFQQYINDIPLSKMDNWQQSIDTLCVCLHVTNTQINLYVLWAREFKQAITTIYYTAIYVANSPTVKLSVRLTA